MIRRPHVKVYHLKLQNLEQVEVFKVSDKPTYDTSLKAFDLEIRGFEYRYDPTSSCEIIPSQT